MSGKIGCSLCKIVYNNYEGNLIGFKSKKVINDFSEEEKKEFGELWQQRVKAIIVDNCNNENVVRVVEL